MARGGLSFMDHCLGAHKGFGNGGQLHDRQLLERYAAQRSESAFAALVERHGPLVLGVCQRVLQNRADAEDAFQATFFVLARKAGTLGRDESLGNWLYTVAYRTAVKAKILAARRRDRERQVSAMSTPNRELDPAWRELQPILDEELNRLPEKYRAPLVLCYLEGKSNHEAAAELGWPSGSMSRRLSRGRQLLRERLMRRGVALSLALVFALVPKRALAASVPSALAHLTIRGAVAFDAARSAAAWSGAARIMTAGGPSSPWISALADAMLRSMGAWGTKLGAFVLLTLALLGFIGTTLSMFPLGVPEDDVALLLTSSCPSHPPASLLSGSSWQLQGTLAANSAAVLAIALAPDGRFLATALEQPEGAVQLWDLEANRRKSRLGGTGGPIRALAFSPDGLTLAAGNQDHSVILWDIPSATARSTLIGHGGEVEAVAFTPDGKVLASGSSDATIRLWHLAAGNEPILLAGHAGPVRSVALSPDGQTLASASLDGTARLWDLRSRRTRAVLSGHAGEVRAVAFSLDGSSLATGGADGTVKWWDTASGQVRRTLSGHSAGVRSVLFLSAGGVLLAASEDQTVTAWLTTDAGPVGEGMRLETAAGHLLSRARLVPKLAIAGSDHKVTVWTEKSERETRDEGKIIR